eukprot:366107_1
MASSNVNLKALIAGFVRDVNTILDEANDTPMDIMNLIFMFLNIPFDFSIIDNKYDTKDTLHENDIPFYYFGYCGYLAIVISLDCDSISIGFAGEDYPVLVIPNVMIRSQSNSNDTLLIGHETKQNRLMETTHLIEYGQIMDWDAIKHILRKALKGTQGHKPIAVVMTVCSAFSKADAEKMTTFMFEQLDVSAFYIVSRAYASTWDAEVNALLIVLDYHCIEIVPIYEHCAMKNAAIQLNVGTRDMLRYSERMKGDNSMDVLFDPTLCNRSDVMQCKGIHLSVIESIDKCDVSVRRELCSKIVLSGADDKLRQQLLSQINSYLGNCLDAYGRFEVITIEDGAYDLSLAWVGASIMVSVSSFNDDQWMTKAQYDEFGTRYIHQKCYNY